MKKTSTVFLQTLIILIGISTLALLLWEPHLEGRNSNATAFQIYFNDPFLAYAYIGSIPFFIALYQAFKVLGYAKQNTVATIKSLRTIQYCAIAIIAFVAVGEIFIMLNASDDRAGGVFMGILITIISIAIASGAKLVERKILQ